MPKSSQPVCAGGSEAGWVLLLRPLALALWGLESERQA